MANRNTQGFGLIPAGTLGATPSTGGQNKYKIDSGYATSLYLGQPVQYDTAGGANDRSRLCDFRTNSYNKTNDWCI